MAIDMARIRKGMEVHTSDGAKLGKVAEVWLGTDPAPGAQWCDEEVCSRLEVHQGGLLKKTALYVPYSAIADVSGETVTLNADEAAARAKAGWLHRPGWISGGVS